MIFRPFLIKIPAHRPQIVPKESWYTFTMLFGFPSIGGSTTGAGSQCVDLSFQPSNPPMKSEPPAKRPTAPTKLEREATRGTVAASAMGRYVRTMGRIHIRIVGGARTAPDTSGDEMGRRRNRLIDMMVESYYGTTWRRPVWLGPHLSGGNDTWGRPWIPLHVCDPNEMCRSQRRRPSGPECRSQHGSPHPHRVQIQESSPHQLPALKPTFAIETLCLLAMYTHSSPHRRRIGALCWKI